MRHQKDVSAGVVVFHRGPAGCEFLLLLSRLTKRPLWEFPKGGVEEGESLLDAALRELEEETGLRRDEIRLIPGFQQSEQYRFLIGEGDERTLIHKQVTYYLAEASHRRVVLSEAETREHAWLPLEQAIRRVRYRARRQILQAAATAADCAAG